MNNIFGFSLLLWICIAGVTDARYRVVSNFIVVLGLGLAFVFSNLGPEIHPLNIKFIQSVLGFFGGFFIFLFFYKLGFMGAADVKFFAALGAWVGWELLLPIWALSCGFAVVHGLVVRSNFKYYFTPAMKWGDGTEKNGKRFIPYVTYLSVATVIVLMLNK